MRAFVDTSSLFKKYVEEAGSQEFSELLDDVLEIIVSPTCWTEVHTVVSRLVREKKISMREAEWIKREIRRDFAFFGKVPWSDLLEDTAVRLVSRHSLRTLDAIQLASGVLSQSDLFVTSDLRLFDTGKKVLRNTRFI